MSWDSSAETINGGEGINQWGESEDYDGSDLMRMLNGYYLGESSCTYCNDWNQATCANNCASNITPLSNNAKNIIENAVWSTRGIERKSYKVKEMYEAEQTSTLTGKECTSGDLCNDNVERKAEWVGKIGLMYSSDWGYASTNENCECMTVFNSTCYQSNWLYISGQYYWTISPSAQSEYANRVLDVLNFSSANSAGYARGVRPSTYLKSNVQIIGGNGSTEPFILK